MEGHCQIHAEDSIKIYNISKALTQGWDRIPKEMREETLMGLKDKVTSSWEKGRVRKEDFHRVHENLDTLLKYNKGEGTIHDVKGFTKPVLDMAIHTISDCECTRSVARADLLGGLADISKIQEKALELALEHPELLVKLATML
jgi:Zn-dependent M32 family carboxypeptidase